MSSANENIQIKPNMGHNGKASDLSKDFQDLGKITSTIASDTAHLVQNAAHKVQDNAAQYYGQGIEQAKKFSMSVESRIQKHPLQSLLIVAGVGLVLGTLWNRR